MQTGGVVLVDDEALAGSAPGGRRRLGGLAEVALCGVLLEAPVLLGGRHGLRPGGLDGGGCPCRPGWRGETLGRSRLLDGKPGGGLRAPPAPPEVPRSDVDDDGCVIRRCLPLTCVPVHVRVSHRGGEGLELLQQL